MIGALLHVVGLCLVSFAANIAFTTTVISDLLAPPASQVRFSGGNDGKGKPAVHTTTLLFPQYPRPSKTFLEKHRINVDEERDDDAAYDDAGYVATPSELEAVRCGSWFTLADCRLTAASLQVTASSIEGVRSFLQPYITRAEEFLSERSLPETLSPMWTKISDVAVNVVTRCTEQFPSVGRLLEILSATWRSFFNGDVLLSSSTWSSLQVAAARTDLLICRTAFIVENSLTLLLSRLIDFFSGATVNRVGVTIAQTILLYCSIMVIIEGGSAIMTFFALWTYRRTLRKAIPARMKTAMRVKSRVESKNNQKTGGDSPSDNVTTKSSMELNNQQEEELALWPFVEATLPVTLVDSEAALRAAVLTTLDPSSSFACSAVTAADKNDDLSLQEVTKPFESRVESMPTTTESSRFGAPSSKFSLMYAVFADRETKQRSTHSTSLSTATEVRALITERDLLDQELCLACFATTKDAAAFGRRKKASISDAVEIASVAFGNRALLTDTASSSSAPHPLSLSSPPPERPHDRPASETTSTESEIGQDELWRWSNDGSADDEKRRGKTVNTSLSPPRRPGAQNAAASLLFLHAVSSGSRDVVRETITAVIASGSDEVLASAKKTAGRTKGGGKRESEAANRIGGATNATQALVAATMLLSRGPSDAAMEAFLASARSVAVSRPCAGRATSIQVAVDNGDGSSQVHGFILQ